MLLKDCDVVYGENAFTTDEKLELFQQFQQQASAEFCNSIYIWISNWAKSSGLTEEEQPLRVRSLMKVLTFPLGVFYSASNDGFGILNKEHITQPVRTFAGLGLSGEGVTEEMMHKMLNSIHPDFGDKLRLYAQEAALPPFLNRVVYWVTFALVEALGESTVKLLQKVLVPLPQGKIKQLD